jgi:hypothetical protein
VREEREVRREEGVKGVGESWTGWMEGVRGRGRGRGRGRRDRSGGIVSGSGGGCAAGGGEGDELFGAVAVEVE